MNYESGIWSFWKYINWIYLLYVIWFLLRITCDVEHAKTPSVVTNIWKVALALFKYAMSLPSRPGTGLTTWRSVGSARSSVSASLGCAMPCGKILWRCQGTWRHLTRRTTERRMRKMMVHHLEHRAHIYQTPKSKLLYLKWMMTLKSLSLCLLLTNFRIENIYLLIDILDWC